MPERVSISKERIQRLFDTTLDEWSFLDDFGDLILEHFADIRLIGEVERAEGRETYETLRACLDKLVVDQECLETICRSATRQWHAVFGLYFVWTGIFAFGQQVGNELWPPVFRGLGLQEDNPALAQECGRLFIRMLRDNNLEQFKTLQERHKYVTRILLHGLIPDHHIDRFITDVIQPALSTTMGRYSDAHSIISKTLPAAHLPRSIQNFMQHGCPINIDVIDRFLDMARRWEEEDDPDLWQLWGLPKYMVEAFRQCRDTATRTPPKRSLRTSMPYLGFDLESRNYPVLFVPPHITPAPPHVRVQYQRLGYQADTEEHYSPNTTRIEGQYLTDPLELPVGPAREGWGIDMLSRDHLPLISRAVHYQFPATPQDDKLALFFFHARTGKLFNARGADALPEDLIVVFPQNARLQVEGGQVIIDPQVLHQAWNGWQYVVCALGASGTLHYDGPNTTLKKQVKVQLPFRRSADQCFPTLAGNQAPAWLYCLETWPVFTTAQPIEVHCNPEAYPEWRRSVGKLTRLDVLERPKGFALAFQAVGGSRVAQLPEVLEPGVYELQLRGALGVEDRSYRFVCLPAARFETRIESEPGSLVSQFHILTEGDFDPEPYQDNTRVERHQDGIVVSANPGSGEAFCALRVFAQSQRPVTVLLARSGWRWCRRQESGSIAWEAWRAIPEEMPIQRVHELQDARVAIQVDRLGQRATAFSRHRLRIVLKSAGEDRTDERVLMAFDAPMLQREQHRTWFINLKPFADQLNALQHVLSADLIVDLGEGNGEIPLFTLQRYSEYKNFRLMRLDATPHHERYRVEWTPQRNDPTSHRVLICSPAAQPEETTCVRLEDGRPPPLDIELPAPQKSAMWTAHIGIQRSRFAPPSSSAHRPDSPFTWFRIPHGWQDWVDWPKLHPDDLNATISLLRTIAPEPWRRTLPWADFLTCFHQQTGKEALHNLRSIVGDAALSKLLPVFPGRIWIVKSAARKQLSLQVVEMESGLSDLHMHFQDLPPRAWRDFPNDFELKLRMQQPHRYLGEACHTWRCF